MHAKSTVHSENQRSRLPCNHNIAEEVLGNPLRSTMITFSTTSLFTQSNIAGIRFPLDARSSPPLHFEPLETLPSIRLRQKSASTSSSSSWETPLDSLVTTDGALAKKAQELFSSGGKEAGPFGEILHWRSCCWATDSPMNATI